MMQRMTTATASRPQPDLHRDATRPPIVLGVDPGLRRTGYSIVRAGLGAVRPGGSAGTAAWPLRDVTLIEAGLVRLDAKAPLEARLVELEQSLGEIIDRHHPTTLACEQLYAHYKHPRTAILMAHARGVILSLAARRHLGILNIAATHVKKFLTGGGHASKPQMQRAVAFTLGLAAPPEPHDVADAIAIGLCGLQMQAMEAATGGGTRRSAR